MAINQNKLARSVCELEGGKVNLPIAQVKEVIACTLRILAFEHKPSEIMALLEKVQDG